LGFLFLAVVIFHLCFFGLEFRKSTFKLFCSSYGREVPAATHTPQRTRRVLFPEQAVSRARPQLHPQMLHK
jgi:hypothetical protein